MEIQHLYLVSISANRYGSPGVYVTAVLAETDTEAEGEAWREARAEGFEHGERWDDAKTETKQIEDAQVVAWAREILKGIGTL